MTVTPIGHQVAVGRGLSAVHPVSLGTTCPGTVGCRSPDFLRATILDTYAPRNATSGCRARRDPLRSACVAAATSSKTVDTSNLLWPKTESTNRRAQLLLKAQDDVRTLMFRLRTEPAGSVSSSQCCQALKGEMPHVLHEGLTKCRGSLLNSGRRTGQA